MPLDPCRSNRAVPLEGDQNTREVGHGRSRRVCQHQCLGSRRMPSRRPDSTGDPVPHPGRLQGRQVTARGCRGRRVRQGSRRCALPDNVLGTHRALLRAGTQLLGGWLGYLLLNSPGRDAELSRRTSARRSILVWPTWSGRHGPSPNGRPLSHPQRLAKCPQGEPGPDRSGFAPTACALWA